MTRFLKALYQDEAGQATVEYILLLGISTGFAVMLVNTLIRPAFEKLSATLSKMIQNRITAADLHTFRVSL